MVHGGLGSLFWESYYSDQQLGYYCFGRVDRESAVRLRATLLRRIQLLCQRRISPKRLLEVSLRSFLVSELIVSATTQEKRS